MSGSKRPPDSGPMTEGDVLAWYIQAAAALGLKDKPTAMYYGQRLSQYPSKEDIANARAAGVGYGSGNEAFTEGQTANVWASPSGKGKPARPLSIGGSGGATAEEVTDPALRNSVRSSQDLADSYMAAQTAISRSPISALGYDPHQIALDLQSGKKVSVAGMYNPSTDSIYANAEFPSNLVHESTHRGLKILRDAKVVPDTVWKQLPSEERIVRYIMAVHMGDPERGAGKEADKQRDVALYSFGRDSNDPQKYLSTSSELPRKTREALNSLTDIAAKYFASRKPGGPR